VHCSRVVLSSVLNSPRSTHADRQSTSTGSCAEFLIESRRRPATVECTNLPPLPSVRAYTYVLFACSKYGTNSVNGEVSTSDLRSSSAYTYVNILSPAEMLDGTIGPRQLHRTSATPRAQYWVHLYRQRKPIAEATGNLHLLRKSKGKAAHTRLPNVGFRS